MKKWFIAVGIILGGIIASYGQLQPNNSCGSATTLPVNASCVVNTFTMPSTFTNDGYTLTGCNVGNARDDGWYQFQAISVVTEITADANEDIIIHVYSGTCGSFTLIGCADAQTTAAEVLNIPTTIGTWYLIRIQRYNSSSGITGGTICINVTNSCDWRLCLQDSYGDGWNNAYLEVFVNGVSIGFAELLSGFGPTCYYLPAQMSGNVSIVFTSGLYDYECSYYIYTDLGALYHSETVMPANYSYTQSCNGSMPIELIEFKATCVSNGRNIEWTTASEVNVANFTIDRSLDGINYNQIVTYEATGAGSYNIFDAGDNDPLVYYRLTEHDYNGSYEMFNPISSNCVLTSNEITVYPNPSYAGEPITITGQYTTIKISDILGRDVAVKIDGANIIGLSSGIYIIQVDGIFMVKLIVKSIPQP